MPGRSRLSMKWLDAPLSAVMVKLTLLVVEEAIEEYPMPRGIVACRVVAGVSVDVVEVAVADAIPCIEAVSLLKFPTTVVEPEFIAVLA